MEAYFHKDSRIEEWIDQITEKVFTVCLLTGFDSEAEFQSGCQIVTKLSSLLLEIPTFPSEYLEDGIKQLVEQQLPDAQIINNFAAFQENMDRMLSEGISSAIKLSKKETLKPAASNSENEVGYILKEHENFMEVTDKKESDKKEFEKEQTEEFNLDEAIPALAFGCITNQEIGEVEEIEVEEILEDPEQVESMSLSNLVLRDQDYDEFSTHKPGTEPEQIVTSSSTTKPYEIRCSSSIPEYADPLNGVLKHLFPNADVSWNINLKGQTFLAQVKNILIFLYDPNKQPCPIEDYMKEGWRVYVCSSEELKFPRRLERGLKQIQRFGKKPQSV